MIVVRVTSIVRPGRGAKAKAKASLRYIMHRPNEAGKRVTRMLFGSDGPMAKYHGYDLIDHLPKGSFYIGRPFLRTRSWERY